MTLHNTNLLVAARRGGSSQGWRGHPCASGRVLGEGAPCQVAFDSGYEFPDVGETALPNGVLRQVTEETFNQVEPRASCGREMHVAAGMLRQPSAHTLMFVGAVVIRYQVQGETWGCLAVDLLKEPQPIHVCMLILSPSDDLSVQIVRAANSVMVPCRI